jgi:hypothetical protein
VSVAPIPSAPADLELIAQLKSRLQYAELRIRVLEERLRLMRIEKYGAVGEKLSDAQMELFELEPVASEVILEAESERCWPMLLTLTDSESEGPKVNTPVPLPVVAKP